MATAAKITAEESKGYKRPPKGKIAKKVADKMLKQNPKFKKKKKTVQQWSAVRRTKPPKARIFPFLIRNGFLSNLQC